MIRGRWDAYRARIRAELQPVFDGNSSAHVVAGSFSIGIFITALPTLGTGLLVMAAIAYASDWVNKLALFAAVVVLNPLVKSGVYVASFSLGATLLGPVPGDVLIELSPAAGPAVLTRLLVGNTLLAISFAAVGYVLIHRSVRAYRASSLHSGTEPSAAD